MQDRISNMDRNFYVVDVFSLGTQPFTGNQLAVFPNAEGYDDKSLQLIAREMNFSETTFIFPPDEENVHANVRIFTPYQEIPFAGHPTLGTAYVLWKFLLKDKPKVIQIKLLNGIIPVAADEHGLFAMTQHPATFGKTVEDLKLVADAIGLLPEDIDESLPVQEVSTGLPFLQIPLKHDKISEIKINLEANRKLIENLDAKALSVFHKDADRVHARVFVHHYGIPEDPATGSNAGCLGAYIKEHLKDPSPIIINQGKEIGRPSLLYVVPDTNPIVGGYSVVSMQGNLMV